MKISLSIFIFFICNFIGLTIVPALYAIAPIYKFINIESDFSANMQYDISYSMIAWLACALFSFASFFLSRKWKVLFLLAPIVMPFIFSIALLSKYI